MSETAEKLKLELSQLSAKERAEIASLLLKNIKYQYPSNI
jgi:hypothetical protein